MLPSHKTPIAPGKYDIFPSHEIGSDRIFTGFDTLANFLSGKENLLIEGYVGVYYEDFVCRLSDSLKQLGKMVTLLNVSFAMKPESEIDNLIAPFLGGDDPVFGTRTTLSLCDLFDLEKLKEICPEDEVINIVYGPGATLTGIAGTLIYIDLPKNEIQYRARRGKTTNLGASTADDPKKMYKRFYFVDWILLNHHKETLLKKIDVIVDGQNPVEPAWMIGDHFREALDGLVHGAFRVRPWFEAGVWGGQWIKDRIEGLPVDVPNYAWSFELITPENGIILESSGLLIEISFDFLMFHDHKAILGMHAEKYGVEFPIRFDFLDTFSGGNLSIQCHPQPEYMTEHFGENFTQEESYYILDAAPGAVCHLGFQEDIDPGQFREALEMSFRNNKALQIEKYVQVLPSKKHDLFLIPPGTIHGSGVDNLVLEISTTPYIFTFKLYDWIRPDLDGKPRPINIEHGMCNLCFDRKGERVGEELVSKPALVASGDDWEHYSLPTHQDHTYDVHRYHFMGEVLIETQNRAHVINLVEGRSIGVETESGMRMNISYAETFVVPAAAIRYHLFNTGNQPATVVVAFMK
ncbi:MAG: class I mannose-6-phosphate isomerase [Bacteroidota bacterium]